MELHAWYYHGNNFATPVQQLNLNFSDTVDATTEEALLIWLLGEATVDPDNLAIHPRRAVAHQERHDRCDVRGLGDAPHGVLLHPPQERLVLPGQE